ncbi:MAG: Hpt domain-containing protein, partial [Colwellia sp.]|nr:Hpt domain-containing protein [Colwellia sp.]
MSFEADEEILQDFLVEAGEILELLSEQLVELENDVDNADLLNAIFRGFHTVKGGAGFLSLTELVDVCHGAENIFDLLRNGQRTVTSELMDTILSALDTVNDMFALVQNREPLVAAEAELLAELHRLSVPEAQESDVLEEPVIAPSEVSTSEPVSTEESATDEMSEDEFERLLDELHGGGSIGAVEAPAVIETSQADSSDEISDDEFESLLDELHGQGAFSAGSSNSTPAISSSSDEINDDEFESLLDELHGKGQAPKASDVAPTPVKKEPSPSPKAVAKPKAAAKPVAKPAKAPAAKAKAAQSSSSQGETTVRVDTKRLDKIMNMVGELVLVRNRLTSLGLTSDDEDLNKAVSNLDAVTTDLQGAVMKTRMQPIKKVFGRFPRVVRDLARSLNKDIKLVLEGEETDLDKNLVEALADPLVHLVRNSVDHGVEEPDVREAMGKPRQGTVILSASQEGD